MKQRLQGLLLCAVLAAVAGTGQAALLTDWGAADVITVSDPNGDQAEDSRDILAVHYRFNGGTHYFRLDLRGAPQQLADEFAPEVSIHLDFANGAGGGAGNSSYIAEDVGTGIDMLVLSHFTVGGGYAAPDHRHIYTGPAAALPRVTTEDLSAIGATVDTAESGGAIIQWAIDDADLVYDAAYTGDNVSDDTYYGGGQFTIYGVTLDIDQPNTYDTTSAIVVPEPATMGLLALSGLALLRRRRK